jgi:DNA-binding LytR/AlgR family response regulator
MGLIKKHLPVKLFIGFIFSDDFYFLKAKEILIKKFGIVDLESEIIDFIYTDYYKKEMGENLKRKFISFRRLIQPDALPQIKIFTNKLENRLSTEQKRNINIDPGYLDMAKVILASTKDYSHRIYLKKGIFAEVTLFYQHKEFHPWAWTYPDYRTQNYREIFNKIRQLYVQQIRCLKK